MEPVDPRVYEYMKGIMELLCENLPSGHGITLLIFNYGNHGRMNYMSTAKREDMIASMKEFIAKNEGRYHDGNQEQN